MRKIKLDKIFGIVAFLGILSLSLGANAGTKKFALLMGGTDMGRHGFFPDILARQIALEGRGFDVRILYGRKGADAAAAASKISKYRVGLTTTQDIIGNAVKKSRFFTKEIYLEEIDRIADQILPGETAEVLVYLTSHGQAFGGKHRTAWGKGSPSTAFAIESLQPLLDRGVRVYFDSSSCYDGEIIDDVQPLLDTYKENLCITTATASNRQSSSTFHWVDAVTASLTGVSKEGGGKFRFDGPDLSVAEAHRLRGYPDSQISSAPEWLSMEEKLEKHYPIRIEDVRALGDNDPELKAFIKTVLGRTQGACSKDERRKRFWRLLDEVDKAAKSSGLSEISVAQSEIPEKECRDGRGNSISTCTVGTKELLLTLFPYGFDFMTNNSPSIIGIFTMKALAEFNSTNPNFSQAYLELKNTMDPKYEEFHNLACEETPGKLAMLIRSFLVERNRKSGRTACHNFVF